MQKLALVSTQHFEDSVIVSERLVTDDFLLLEYVINVKNTKLVKQLQTYQMLVK